MPPRKSRPRQAGIAVSLVNDQANHTVDERRLVEAVEAVVRDSEFSSAEISVAVIDDAAMQELNRQYLQHDYPTDVLSFVLGDEAGHLLGEVILSADTAATEAAAIGWPAAAEQLLYVIHGTLHLVGYRDKSPAESLAMRVAEAKYLQQFGFEQPQAAEGSVGAAPTGQNPRRGATSR